jgi:hypothetical protein
MKLDHHKSRLEWWKVKKEEALQKIRDGGIEVHESLVSQYSKTGYTGGGHVAEAQIMVDSTLQKDLDECAGKIRMHQAKIEDYSAYVELLSKRPQNDRFDLHMDDWQHFFGK